MTVFSGNTLGGDVHLSVTMDRHVQSDNEHAASPYSLEDYSGHEAWGRNGVSLEKCVSSHAEWLLTG